MNAAHGLAGVSCDHPCRKLILKCSAMIRVWGEQQKSNHSLKEEERKFGVETPKLLSGEV